MLAVSLLLAVQTPSPEAIWGEVVKAYKSKKSFSASFTTRQVKPAKTVYRGTVSFARDKSYKFSLQDLGEKCRAGEEWSKGNGASTWVSPAEFRGYNDTITARHPYILLDLLRGSTDEGDWKPGVAGKMAATTIERTDGWKFTIDRRSNKLLSFSGPELYNEERICVTTIR